MHLNGLLDAGTAIDVDNVLIQARIARRDILNAHARGCVEDRGEVGACRSHPLHV